MMESARRRSRLILLPLLLMSIAPQTGCAQCVGGTLDTTNNVCYTYYSQARTQGNAAASCQAVNSQLISVENRDQQVMLERVLQDQSVQSTVWLGGRLQQTTYMASNYRWISDCRHCGRDGEVSLAVGLQGCYVDDSSSRDLPYEHLGQQSSMTPAVCVSACRNVGYQYAGLQAGYRCFCGNSYGRYKHINTEANSNAACTIPCYGDSSQHCGGSGNNAIYYVLGSYVMWGYNKPNNYGGYQTCVVMNSGVSYKFDDDSCSETLASYICSIRTTQCPTWQQNYYVVMVGTDSHCIYVSPSSVQMTWFAARQDCIAKSGDLAKIGSESIRLAIKDRLSANKYWIGLVGLVWYWGNGNDMVYSRWYNDTGSPSSREPNTLDNQCLVADPQRQYSWFDSDCNQLNAYVCMRDLSVTTSTQSTTTTTQTTTTPTTTPSTTQTSTTSSTTPSSTTSPSSTSTSSTTSSVTTSSTTASAPTTTTTTDSGGGGGLDSSTTTSSPIALPTTMTTTTTPTASSTMTAGSVPLSSPTSTAITAAVTTTPNGIASSTSSSSANAGGVGGSTSVRPVDQSNNSSQFNSSGTDSNDTTTDNVVFNGAPNADKSSLDVSLSVGYIVLIVLCVVLFIIVVIVIICYAVCCRSSQKVEQIDMRSKASYPEGDPYYDSFDNSSSSDDKGSFLLCPSKFTFC